MVLARIERSPKIFDFRASGIPVQKRVDFFDTLKQPPEIRRLLSYRQDLPDVSEFRAVKDRTEYSRSFGVILW